MGKIKSDGLNSKYYELDIPTWLWETLYVRQEDGRCYIKVEELGEMLGNDFNYVTLLKSMVRALSLENGGGKEGNTHGYECNKMRYYVDRIEDKFNREEGE